MKTDLGWIPQEGWEKRDDVGNFCLWCYAHEGSGWMYIHLKSGNTVCGRHLTQHVIDLAKNWDNAYKKGFEDGSDLERENL